MTAQRGKIERPLRLAVVHWLPLEQFPPAKNLLDLFGNDPAFRITACTSIRAGESHPWDSEAVNLHRSTFPGAGRSALVRLLQAVRLYLTILFGLLQSRAEAVLYFEPHSAPAVFLYLLWNRSARLFIHYHEYRELSHYRDRGNAIARLGHWLEIRWLFRRCHWISHTNSDRVRMFLDDHPQVPATVMQAVPNYPPPEWLVRSDVRPPAHSASLRLIYVGAVSLHDTFIREVADWVVDRGEQRVRLDIYGGSTSSSAQEYLVNLASPAVRFFPAGVPYERLPEILGQYDVGLVLYRGTTRNYIYNAPNKLFEYLICGLDVWYPRQMLSIRPVAAALSLQRALEVDFDQPAMLDALLKESRHARTREWNQTCADALQPLRQALLEPAPCG
jgi:hypothetical protein